MWPKTWGHLQTAQRDGGATAIAGGSEEVVDEVRLRPRTCFDVRYEGFIGAKKHLVLGPLSYIGPPQGKNSVAIG